MNSASFISNPDAKLTWKERIGYGIGGMSGQIVFSIIGSFFAIYMTNVALLDIAAISTIIAVSKVLDGISDVIVGNTIDNTVSRFGRARVWLIRMCLPLAVSTVFLFWVPSGWPKMMQYVYVFIMYNIVSTFCLTFMRLAQYSLLAFITRNSKEQGLLGSLCSLFQWVGIISVSVFFVKVLLVFTDVPGVQNTQRAYTGTVLFYVCLMIISSLITVFSTKERVTDRIDKDKVNIKEFIKNARTSVKALLTTRYWGIMILCAILMNITMQFAMMGQTYFAMYVLGDIANVSWLAASMMIPSFAMLFVVPFLLKLLQKKTIFSIGCSIAVIGLTGFGLAVPHIPLMVFFNILKGAGTGTLNGVLLGMIADTVTYTDKVTGVYSSGMGNAGVSAAEKLGQGIGSVLFGFALAKAGFDSMAAAQPEAVPQMISLFYIWIPTIFTAIMLVLILFFFDLEKKMSQKD